MGFPIKLLPYAVLSIVAVGVFTVVESLFDDSFETEHYDEETPKQVQSKMKTLNDELARLTDIKMLNDRRESTNQVRTVEVTVDGVEVNELIATVETELNRLVKLNASMRQKDGGKKRKKRV